MKKFMAVFLGTGENMDEWNKLDEKTRKEREKAGMIAWGKWGEEYKHTIVENGAPLGKTKRINKEGISDTKNELAAWSIVQAENYEEAAKVFLNHPHFTIFPGDRVEIMECLPIPEMPKG